MNNQETTEEQNVNITCNINKLDTKANQLIYCSQLYGTFFAVSAKFNIEKGFLKSMTLTLINFKGLYNIGMLKETKSAFKLEGNGAKLTLYLKANAGRHGKRRQLNVKCDNIPIDELKGLIVTRELQKLSNKSKSDHLREGIFDSEFYQRDGSLIEEFDRLDNKEQLTRQDRCKTTYSNFV